MDDRIYVATRKGLFAVERNGAKQWAIARAAFVGDNVSAVLADRRNATLYAALEHGHFGAKLHRSRDGGVTWEECAVPAYPPKPEGVEDLDPMRKTPIPWSLQRVWVLESGAADEPGTLWCGTIPGGLFRSDDGASSWRLVDALWNREERRQWFGGGADYPGIHSICVDPRDARHVAVAISCGGVWLTGDGGESWRLGGAGMQAAYLPPESAGDPNIQDAHRLAQCRAQPDVFWCQHHNGIYRSADGCGSWQEITGVPVSAFGFAVAAHPQDPQTAWFVPASKDEKRIPVDGKLAVLRTRDGGRSFVDLRSGLPQSHAYDLVFRHALDIDQRGERLAFGSTTGSLWVSEDGGEHWLCVSTHLPPIHAVRFAPSP
jgi:hypothetical protein